MEEQKIFCSFFVVLKIVIEKGLVQLVKGTINNDFFQKKSDLAQ